MPSEQATQEAAKRSSNTGFQSLCGDYLELLRRHQALHNRLSGNGGINGFATPEEADIMKGIAAWDAACQSLDGPVAAKPNLPGVLGAHSQTVNDIYANAWAAYQKARASVGTTTSGQTGGLPPARPPAGLPPPPPLRPGQTNTVKAAQPPVGLPPPPPLPNGASSANQPMLGFKPPIGGGAGGPPKPPPPPPPLVRPVAAPVVKSAPQNAHNSPSTSQPDATGQGDLASAAMRSRTQAPLKAIKYSDFGDSAFIKQNDAKEISRNTESCKKYMEMYALYREGKPIPPEMGIFDKAAAKMLGEYLIYFMSTIQDEALQKILKQFKESNATLETFYKEYQRFAGTQPKKPPTSVGNGQKPDAFKALLANRRRGIEGQHSDSDDDDDIRPAVAKPKPSTAQPHRLTRQDSWEDEDNFDDVPKDLKRGLTPQQLKNICSKLKGQGIVWGQTPEEDFRKAFIAAQPKTTARSAVPAAQDSSDSDDEGTTIVAASPKSLPKPASTGSSNSAGMSPSPASPQSTTPVGVKGNNPYSEWIDVSKLTGSISQDPAAALLAQNNLTKEEKAQVEAFLKANKDELKQALATGKRALLFQTMVNGLS